MKVFNRLEALLSKQSACSQDSHVHQPLMTLVCLNLRLWVWHKQLRTDQNPSSSFLLLPHLISAGSVSSNLVSTFSSSFICELIKNIPPYYYCKGVCKAYATSLRMITLILLRLCVCVCVRSAHLPGLTAPPAGIGSDVQRPTARLSGEKGELAHGATDKAAQVGSHRVAGVKGRRGEPERQQQQQA